MGDNFEKSSSVKGLVDKFITDTNKTKGPNSKVGVSDVTSEPNLFSVGNSSFFMDGSCSSGSCSFNFSIRDWFRDPVGLGFEIPGGVPYRINHDFNVITINEGSTRVTYRNSR